MGTLGMRNLASELDYRDGRQRERWDIFGTAEILTEYKELISVGQPREGISKLGGLHRQLLQEADFHANGRTLLRKRNSEDERQSSVFDWSNFPKDIRAAVFHLDQEGVSTLDLKATAQKALRSGDPQAFAWVLNNFNEFIHVNRQDAMYDAERGLVWTKADDDDDDFAENFSFVKKGEVDRGFSMPPRDSYQVVEVFRPNHLKEASERRIAHLKAGLRRIQQCTSPKEVEDELGRIRPAYQEDRDLLKEWSKERKEEDRALYLSILHRRGLDFETIRRKMWATFDREAAEVEYTSRSEPRNSKWLENYDSETGKVRDSGLRTEEEISEAVRRGKGDLSSFVCERVTYRACIWEMERSRALCELNQTRGQWGRIYEYLWQKMTDTVIWKLNTIKKYDDGLKVLNIIRRYRTRLNAEELGKAILDKAKKAKTERGISLIRQLLGACQTELSVDTKKEIHEEIRRCARLSNLMR